MNLFNLIKKEQEYWLVDQLKVSQIPNIDYLVAFDQLLTEWKEQKAAYLSLLMDEENEDWLLERQFNKVSSIVEYTKTLEGPFNNISTFQVESLSASEVTDSDFAILYDACRRGSANKNNLFSISQIMESLELELGANWRDQCFIFSQEGMNYGISIPHIEQGTTDEGRMFYFGVVPEQRGKGYGKIFHAITLELLKTLGAKVYVGSTDTSNKHMRRIFETNGCILRDIKGIYRIDIEKVDELN
ncbi:GNAT family N-acetyltransferase [Psychrobacillus antarcticus]|uniref:GNAT family N-acetyltransferase n=1 Tax=Psychrobacillus antarcticus TaxID=2879115 RepID=UPI0024085D78|nr:GNAT family N-acetyltransferase [Psychrobacillus antarcticus]